MQPSCGLIVFAEDPGTATPKGMQRELEARTGEVWGLLLNPSAEVQKTLISKPPPAEVTAALHGDATRVEWLKAFVAIPHCSSTSEPAGLCRQTTMCEMRSTSPQPWMAAAQIFSEHGCCPEAAMPGSGSFVLAAVRISELQGTRLQCMPALCQEYC